MAEAGVAAVPALPVADIDQAKAWHDAGGQAGSGLESPGVSMAA